MSRRKPLTIEDISFLAEASRHLPATVKELVERMYGASGDINDRVIMRTLEVARRLRHLESLGLLRRNGDRFELTEVGRLLVECYRARSDDQG